MAPRLTQEHKTAIALIARSKDIGDGWRQCAPKIYKYLRQSTPTELIEFDDTTNRARLTPQGSTILHWIVEHV